MRAIGEARSEHTETRPRVSGQSPITALIKKVQKGTATLADLTTAGATQRGVGLANDYPCNDTGNDCDTIYAVSIPGVKPSANIAWFQAQQARGNAGKRLLTNAEWQMAAAGTPDPGTDNNSTDCNIIFQGIPTYDPVNTNSRAKMAKLYGPVVKNMGKKSKLVTTCYQGEWFDLGSETHHALIKRAICAKLDAHPEMARAFVATRPRPIVHNTGRPSSDRAGSLTLCSAEF
jgi:hypothetical protein